MNQPTRLPDGWQQFARRAALYWRDAEATCARHQAHIIVSIMGKSEDALRIARVITAVVGALTANHPSCSGVLFNSVVNSSQTFAQLSRSAFASYPDLPSALWVSVQLSREVETGRVVALSLGLRNFTGREIELDGPAPLLESVITMARGLIVHLLQDGVTLRDGDTIGESATQRTQVHVIDSRRFQGLPVFAASLPTAQFQVYPRG